MKVFKNRENDRPVQVGTQKLVAPSAFANCIPSSTNSVHSNLSPLPSRYGGRAAAFNPGLPAWKSGALIWNRIGPTSRTARSFLTQTRAPRSCRCLALVLPAKKTLLLQHLTPSQSLHGYSTPLLANCWHDTPTGRSHTVMWSSPTRTQKYS